MNERIKELAEQAGLYIAYDNRAVTDKELERFAELVAADEREACAKLCEYLGEAGLGLEAIQCAIAIRKRGEK
jgi:hypothetical protein